MTPTLSTIAAFALTTLGTALWLHATFQARVMRRRVARGEGTLVFDPATGFVSAAAAEACIRAEASRAGRRGYGLDVWVGTAASAETVDAAGPTLEHSLDPTIAAIRVDRTTVCLLARSGGFELGADASALQWSRQAVEAGPRLAERTLVAMATTARLPTDG